jgi:hypothetical protein
LRLFTREKNFGANSFEHTKGAVLAAPFAFVQAVRLPDKIDEDQNGMRLTKP